MSGQVFALPGRHAFTSFDPVELAQVRATMGTRPEHSHAAFAQLLEKANIALGVRTSSVLDKRGTAPSGRKNDFYAIGAYSWPDPNAGSDAPYIRRDGLKNPAAYGNEYDKGSFNKMVSDVNTLALTYFFTSDERYAAKAGDLLRSWFIDPRTRMNPNLRYAAVQPGVNDGYYGGIIEGVVLIEMLDYVELLRGSTSLAEKDFQSIAVWFGQFSDWLMQSEFGKKEIRSRNNHGSWFAAQVMAFSLYSGNRSRARDMIELAHKNFRVQFDSDGSMPREMKRSNSFMYAVYGLRSFVTLAQLSDHLGTSLWRVGDRNRPELENAFYFLAPFFSGTRKWEGQMIDTQYDQYAVQIFRLAGKVYRTRPFNDVVVHLVRERPETDRFTRLLGLPTTPVDAEACLPSLERYNLLSRMWNMQSKQEKLACK